MSQNQATEEIQNICTAYLDMENVPNKLTANKIKIAIKRMPNRPNRMELKSNFQCKSKYYRREATLQCKGMSKVVCKYTHLYNFMYVTVCACVCV